MDRSRGNGRRALFYKDADARAYLDLCGKRFTVKDSRPYSCLKLFTRLEPLRQTSSWRQISNLIEISPSRVELPTATQTYDGRISISSVPLLALQRYIAFLSALVRWQLIPARLVYKYATTVSGAIVLFVLTLWCISSVYAMTQPKLLSGSIQCHPLHKEIWYISDKQDLSVSWAEIRKLPDGTWEPTIRIELDQLWFGFGFYAESGKWLGGGEIAVPFWFLLVLAALPAVPFLASRIAIRSQRRSGFQIKHLEKKGIRQNSNDGQNRE